MGARERAVHSLVDLVNNIGRKVLNNGYLNT